MENDPIAKQLFLRLKLYKLEQYPAECSVLLHEIMSDSELKSGYIVINKKDCCWHTWVEKGGQVFDLGLEIAASKDPEFGSCEIERFETPPEGVEVSEDPELVKRFSGSRREFWKSSPKKFQDFRSKTLSKHRSSS